MVEARKRQIQKIDFILILVVLALGAFSCMALLAASYGKSAAVIGTTHIVEKQMVWEVVGLIAMVGVASYDYRLLRKWRWWIYGISVFLLAVVYGFSTINNAHSWIHFGSFTVEPSEFAKLGLIVSVAASMANVDEQEEPHYGFRNVIPTFGLLVAPFALTYKEPALGQALVMFAIVMTMYVVFAKRTHFFMLSSLLLIIVAGVAYMALELPVQFTNFVENLVKHKVLRGFQVDRIVAWINPNFDLQTTGYAVHHAQIAVGSGGLFGEGLFKGILTSSAGVPNQTTDYIFTAIGEEFGFVASGSLILLFLILVYRISKGAAQSSDSFGTYILMGIAGMFGFQVFENIGMNMYLSPATGITLPFISYGGTSLLANYMAIGLCISVAIRRKQSMFINT